MVCELCQNGPVWDFHHFIPRTLHKKKRFQRQYTKEQLAKGLNLCKMCHNTIHDMATERELGESWNTKKLLLEHPEIGKYVRWKRKHKT